MNVTICTPTFRKYDLYKKLVESAERGSVVPTKYVVFDNGGKFNAADFGDLKSKIHVIYSGNNLGVAKAWNSMIRESDDIRIICNDDIEFSSDMIKVFIDLWEDNKLLYPTNSTESNIFSCFSISNYIFNTVGEFDESISPNYGYFEDNDFYIRFLLQREKYNINFKNLPCSYSHTGSASLKSFNSIELEAHHAKFRLARTNFKKKWGGEPGNETFATPYNRGYW
jgi:hypothetical protein